MLVCCEEFEAAMEEDSGNDGEGIAIEQVGTMYWVGANLDPIVFCPWCGKVIENETRF
jgi:hypothetical protein